MNTKEALNDKVLEQVAGGAAIHVDREKVETKIINLLKEQLDLNSIDIRSENVIIDDLGADSLDVIDLMQRVEEEFKIRIPESSFFTVKTVGDLCELVISSLDRT